MKKTDWFSKITPPKINSRNFIGKYCKEWSYSVFFMALGFVVHLIKHVSHTKGWVWVHFRCF